MKRDIRAEIVADINAFLKRHGMQRQQFGWLATNIPSQLLRIENNSYTGKVIDRVYTFMDKYDRDNPTHN